MTTKPGPLRDNHHDKHRTVPTSDGARLDCLDVLRGFAVLAIFIVNVKMMANGFNHYHDITQWEGELAEFIGLLQSRLVHGKFVTIFTALFGAGIALLLAREVPVPRRIVLRRLAWLAVFGGLHLIFLREGDILIWYALAGFLAVPFARCSVATLIVAGLLLQAAAYTVYVVFPFSVTDAPILWRLTPDAHEGVAAIMLGSPGGMIAARLEAAQYYMVDLFLLGGVWIDTLGLMLLGMALLKTGFLSGKRPLKSYVLWGAVGLVIASGYYIARPYLDADAPVQGLVLGVTRYAHRFGGALAWSSLIIGLVIVGWTGSGLAAVGRTAFTVYIFQSAIGLLLFSSLGFGLFGQLSLPVLMIVALLVWVGFLIAAPLWLRVFRFGPLEWIWRSLTYGAWQPLLRRYE
ncbi:MAG: DUF418 domain-containing protein [Pseudomonadota bacterium]